MAKALVQWTFVLIAAGLVAAWTLALGIPIKALFGVLAVVGLLVACMAITA